MLVLRMQILDSNQVYLGGSDSITVSGALAMRLRHLHALRPSSRAARCALAMTPISVRLAGRRLERHTGEMITLSA